MKITDATNYLFDVGPAYLLCACLKSCINGTYPAATHKETTIVNMAHKSDESFINCAILALDLIHDVSPSLDRIVSRNLKYIIGDAPKSKKWAGKYHRRLEGCFVNWGELIKGERVAQNQLLAAIIIHEAYHGECYRIYGVRAYDSRPFEEICRRREIRFLRHFMRTNDTSMNIWLKNRIEGLETAKY